MGAGLRLLPFFGTPMVVAPLADIGPRIGPRPVMVTGMSLQALGFLWVAARGPLGTSLIELTVALLVAGVGVSMALPTVPAAVLDAVAPEKSKASGISYMAQRFGTVFALAIATAVFAAHGHLGTPPVSPAEGLAAFVPQTLGAAQASISAVVVRWKRPESNGSTRTTFAPRSTGLSDSLSAAKVASGTNTVSDASRATAAVSVVLKGPSRAPEQVVALLDLLAAKDNGWSL